jgi:2-hydroxy-3-keto-5-methylthiopentenyl-1-phosphate phosphatase
MGGRKDVNGSMATRSGTTARKASLLKPIMFCDFDGTITQVDVTDEILTQLANPSWREIEQEWACGSIGSRECLERQLALVDASAEELDALIDAIPVDPGFSRFLQSTERTNLPFYVVSDGFDYVVRRVLKRAGVNGQLRNGTHLFASSLDVEGRRMKVSFPHTAKGCAHGCATCKAEVMRRLSQGRKPVIFAGDGLSDRFAVEEADIVFAKRQLLVYCRKQRIACRPFETFDDIQASLAEMLGELSAARRAPRSDQKKRAAAALVR